MSDAVFNIALGKVKYYAELPATNDALVVVLLKSSGLEDNTTLKAYDHLAAILAASNDECTFTNYVRKSITSTTVTVDDSNELLDIDLADQTWSNAGGASNNTVGALLVCYDPDTTSGTDSSIVPLTKSDFTVTTNGSDIVAQFAETGWFRGFQG